MSVLVGLLALAVGNLPALRQYFFVTGLVKTNPVYAKALGYLANASAFITIFTTTSPSNNWFDDYHQHYLSSDEQVEMGSLYHDDILKIHFLDARDGYKLGYHTGIMMPAKFVKSAI